MHQGTVEVAQDGGPEIPTLATPRLLLRGWFESDIDPYVEMCQSPNVMEYVGTGRPLNRDEVLDRLDRIDAYWSLHGFGMFAVVEAATDSFVGFCGFSSPTYAPEIMPAIEIGCRFGQSHWSQGFGSEASTAILDWGFANHGFDGVVAVIQRSNLRAVRLARHLGMVEGVSLSIGPTSVPSALYRLSAERWQTVASS